MSSPRPEVLLSPVALGALAALLVNDHLGKAVAPGLVTGKLSDVAGLVLVPLLAVAIAARLPGGGTRPDRVAAGAALACGLAFALVKTWPPAELAYEVVMGVARWPLDAAVAGLLGRAVAGPGRVELVRDATDLVALAALAIPVLLLGRRGSPPLCVAVSGPASIAVALDKGDGMIATEPDADLVTSYRDGGGDGARRGRGRADRVRP